MYIYIYIYILLSSAPLRGAGRPPLPGGPAPRGGRYNNKIR